MSDSVLRFVVETWGSFFRSVAETIVFMIYIGMMFLVSIVGIVVNMFTDLNAPVNDTDLPLNKLG